MSDLPNKVIIGVQTFDIIERSRTTDGMLHDGTYGYTVDEENLIVIDADLQKTKKQVTLLHEILHACIFVYGGNIKPKKSDDFDIWEHYFIGTYEHSLLGVLRDNEEIVKWLMN